ncbi:hypothetical protein FACS1894184_09930 [Clostridia bacterium]|nr:hypothetical protein FACS1894184_09930 [Clostridia bacterium]
MSRGRRPKYNWHELETAFQASGLTEVEWCQQQGINIYAFRKHVGLPSISSEKVTKTEWMEINTEQNTAAKETTTTQGSGWLTIEYGALRMTADAGYPVDLLSTLLREMCVVC